MTIYAKNWGAFPLGPLATHQVHDTKETKIKVKTNICNWISILYQEKSDVIFNVTCFQVAGSCQQVLDI